MITFKILIKIMKERKQKNKKKKKWEEEKCERERERKIIYFKIGGKVINFVFLTPLING